MEKPFVNFTPDEIRAKAKTAEQNMPDGHDIEEVAPFPNLPPRLALS